MGGRSQAEERLLPSFSGLGSVLLIGQLGVLGHLWQAAKAPLSCHSRWGGAGGEELASPESLLALRQKKKSSFVAHFTTQRAINDLRNRRRKWEKARQERFK